MRLETSSSKLTNAGHFQIFTPLICFKKKGRSSKEASDRSIAARLQAQKETPYLLLYGKGKERGAFTDRTTESVSTFIVINEAVKKEMKTQKDKKWRQMLILVSFYDLFARGFAFVCVFHLVMFGTVCMTELQSESRPIFSMQPVMSRKNRKAPHTATITFIHMCSL